SGIELARRAATDDRAHVATGNDQQGLVFGADQRFERLGRGSRANHVAIGDDREQWALDVREPHFPTLNMMLAANERVLLVKIAHVFHVCGARIRDVFARPGLERLERRLALWLAEPV